MPRAATTSDVFNAIAEPRRRELIALLGRSASEWPVGLIAGAMRLPQPAVSKHLRVLRQVGLVSVTRRGRSRVYRLNPKGLKTVFDWVKHFERHWTHQLDRIKVRAERMAREAN